MKRGTEMTWICDDRGRPALQITKKRGKLTLDEIEDLLRYESGQRYCGYYAIILNCSEATVDGGGLYLEGEQKGDSIDLYQIEDGNTCPVCGKYTPPFEYCPSCGTAWKDMDLNVETLISAMRADAEHAIKSENPSQAQDNTLAQYWSYIGAVNMAKRLGMITDQRCQDLYKEAKGLKDLAQRQTTSEQQIMQADPAAVTGIAEASTTGR